MNAREQIATVVRLWQDEDNPVTSHLVDSLLDLFNRNGVTLVEKATSPLLKNLEQITSLAEEQSQLAKRAEAIEEQLADLVSIVAKRPTSPSSK